MRQTTATAPEVLPTHPGVDGHHSCTECPVCGTEECSVLQELGTSCDTAQAATEARRERPAGRQAPRHPARPPRW